MADNKRTRVAVLGTLLEFHDEAIPFDMSALLDLVANINPDLLCLDITPEQWLQRDFEKLPPQYHEALLPLAQQTDIVIAPIGGEKSPPTQRRGGWRGKVINRLRKWIATMQNTASGPNDMNQGWRHNLTNYLYDATRWLAGGNLNRETKEYVAHLVQTVLEVSRRDRGARVLVVVNIQHCHLIRETLRMYDDIELPAFTEL